jgi:phenylalanyl-tRNA synthetase beta chain
MIKELAGGEIHFRCSDIYPEEIQPFKVSMKFKNIDRLIGKKLDHEIRYSRFWKIWISK